MVTAREVYFISFGSLHVVLFFRLLDIARQLIGNPAGKQSLSLILAVLTGITIFVLFNNFANLLQLLQTNPDKIKVPLNRVAQGTIALLSLILICTLFRDFILFR